MTTQPPNTPGPDQPYGLGYVMPPQPKRSRLPWIVTAVAVAIAAGGVGVAIASAGGGSNEPVAASSSPSASPTAAGPVRTITVGKRYRDVAELRGELESKTSVRCTAYEEIASPTGALERATCTTEIVLSIYLDQEQAEATAKQIGELVAGSLATDSIHLVGENWTVNCGADRALGDELQAALGGELVISKPQ
jgi:hypothetical protein